MLMSPTVGTIYVLCDTLDKKYFSGKYPQWGAFDESKIWHRLRDAKLIKKRMIERFGYAHSNAEYRMQHYSTNQDVIDEFELLDYRLNQLDCGLNIVELECVIK